MEFEEVIYWRFFILSKKRYMYTSCLEDGIVDEKVGKKGVLLARRDNSPFIRNIYEAIIMKIFQKEHRDDILYFILQEINKLCGNYFPHTDFIITKSIGDIGDLSVIEFENEKGEIKGKIGDYTVSLLSKEPDKRKEQILNKDAVNAKDYYLKSLPAQVQLAEKMRRRGQRVDAGSRLEYVITTNGGHKANQSVKVENADYFAAHNDILRIDFMYYLKQLSSPMDQVLNIAYLANKEKHKYPFQKDFVLNQYKYRLKVRQQMLDELVKLFQPDIIFE